MTTVNKQLVASQKASGADTPQVFYTSPSNGFGTIITNFTASNDTAATRTYQAYIVVSGGSATVPVVPTRAIVTNRTDTPPELAGQFIPAGGTLQMESDAATSIAWLVSGRELS